MRPVPDSFVVKAAAGVLAAATLVAVAQGRIQGAEPGRHVFDRPLGGSATSSDENELIRLSSAVQNLLRSEAHARLEDRIADTAPAASCPAGTPKAESRRWSARAPQGPGSVIARQAPPRPRWATVAAPVASASAVFRDFVSSQVVQARCVKCHVRDGQSGHTRLIFASESEPDHLSGNLAALESYVGTVPGGADTILDKVRGIAHGGGSQLGAGTADFANTERLVRMLEGTGAGMALSPRSLFDGVTMASPARTLRRAALVFAGRIPTREEVASVADGSVDSLRSAIRALMGGDGFHEFLIRAANDRLLTDRHLFSVFDFRTETDLVDLANLQWRAAERSIGRGYERADQDPAYAVWESLTQFGIARAPLELIAHVVENDRPYTEVLTADYTMANSLAAQAYGSSTRFAKDDPPDLFRPARIGNYFRNDFSKHSEFDVLLGTRVLNSGNLETTYPHAGILNSQVYLRRYPTTASNRNRARARHTLLYFLGFDVEDLARRPTEVAVLAGSGNPTLTDASCTACHSMLDSVAGTFQNYDAKGGYKSSFGGADSLPDSYKIPPDGGWSAYMWGDTWYRDMAAPGFEGEFAPDSDNSLQWLAARLASHKRFATGTVRFWWPAVMGADLARAPENAASVEGGGQLLAAFAQAGEVERIAAAFRTGIDGGAPYNVRDLLTEMALSPWFRAESVANDDPLLHAALHDAGAGRLLAPEELARKTASITGYMWGRQTRGFVHEVGHLDGEGAGVGGAYELLYGGIDSDGISTRARSITPLMTAVAQGHAIRTSCAIVQREFFLWSPERRQLFDGIDADVTPDSGPAANDLVAVGDPQRTRGWARGADRHSHRMADQNPWLAAASDRGDSAPRAATLAPGSGGSPELFFEPGPGKIRSKLVDLHWKLFGARVAPDSPDVEAAYRLFVRVWQRKRATEGGHFSDGGALCPIEDTRYFDGVLDDVVVIDERGTSRIDWSRVRASGEFDLADPNHTVRTWAVVLAYLMSDFRYLYL